MLFIPSSANTFTQVAVWSPAEAAYLQRLQLYPAIVVFVQGLEGGCGKARGNVRVSVCFCGFKF